MKRVSALLAGMRRRGAVDAGGAVLGRTAQTLRVALPDAYNTAAFKRYSSAVVLTESTAYWLTGDPMNPSI